MPEIIGNMIWIPVRDSDAFKQDTFRIIDINKTKGIKARIGKLSEDSKTVIQAFAFNMELGWNMESAQEWVKQNKSLKSIDRNVSTPKSDVNKPDNVLYTTSVIKTSQKDDRRLISGFASTPALDSYHDIILPEAFEAGDMSRFINNPVMSFNHGVWYGDEPIGSWINWNTSEQGFYVEGELSKALNVDNIWTKIQEGHIKAFSVGGYVPNGGEHYDDELGINIIDKFDLYEIGVVGLPANPESLTGAAKAGYEFVKMKYFNGYDFNNKSEINKPNILISKENTVMSDESQETKQPESVVLDVKELTAHLDKTQSENIKAMSTITDAIKGIVEKGESRDVKLMELYEKSKEEMSQRMEALQKEVETMRRSREVHHADRPEYWGAEDGGHSGKKASLKYILNRPSNLISPSRCGISKETAKDIAEVNDELVILHTLFNHARKQPNLYTGERLTNGEVFATFQNRIDEVRGEFDHMTKSLDTQTSGYGADWVPTNFSAEMVQRVDLALEVASQFRTIPMPSNPFKKRGKGARSTAYLIPEPTTDTAALLPASTPGTRVVTFDAPTVGIRIIESMEVNEDTLINMVAEISRDIVDDLRYGIDNCTMNGDETATHMDGATTNPAANDVRRAFYGLRYYIIQQTSMVYTSTTVSAPNTAAWEIEDITKTQELMGKFGQNPRELVHFASTGSYYKTKAFTNFATMDKYGTFATWLTGYLQSIAGSPYIITETVPDTAETTGLITDALGGTTMHIIANRTRFENGDRRQITADVIRDPETQQYRFVSTIRRDFQKLDASTDYTAAAAVAITV